MVHQLPTTHRRAHTPTYFQATWWPSWCHIFLAHIQQDLLSTFLSSASRVSLSQLVVPTEPSTSSTDCTFHEASCQGYPFFLTLHAQAIHTNLESSQILHRCTHKVWIKWWHHTHMHTHTHTDACTNTDAYTHLLLLLLCLHQKALQPEGTY